MNVVGDIAGQFTALQRLMAKVPKQRTIFIGDPNDRGWESKQVIQYCIDNESWITLLDSNHGDMFVDWYKAKTDPMWVPRYDKDIFAWNGGIATMTSYGYKLEACTIDDLLADKDLKAHIEFLASRPSHLFETINGQKYMFTHAPMTNNRHRRLDTFLRKGTGADDHDTIGGYLWNRHEPEDFHPDTPDTISVFGHNAGTNLKVICEQYKDGVFIKGGDYLRQVLDKNKGQVYGICVDTSRDKKLCCLDLNNMDIATEYYPTEAKMY